MNKQNWTYSNSAKPEISKDKTDWPKISIVTPNYNQEKYIENTIQSVLTQNYPNLEYIIIDGGSTDNSVNIIKKYSKQITYWVSEKDNGLYDALNKGFNKATGSILMYINSDDILLPGSLILIGKIFIKYPNINWLTGYNHWINESNEIFGSEKSKQWSIFNFLRRDYGWIQQESTVWSRNIWEKSGLCFNTKYELAGDLELWSRFFLISNPTIVDFGIGAFRFRKNQLSQYRFSEYNNEAIIIIKMMSKLINNKILIKAFIYKILCIAKYLIRKTIIFNHIIIIFIIDSILIKIRGKGERILYKNGDWQRVLDTSYKLYRL